MEDYLTFIEDQATVDRHGYAHKVIKPDIRSRHDKKVTFNNEVSVIESLKNHRHVIRIAATYATQNNFGLLLKPEADKNSLGGDLSKYWESVRHSVSSSSDNPKYATENYVIPSVLENGNHVDAIGDYCAKRNFMTKSYAKRLGLVIDRKQVMSVLTGSGNTLKTIGSATARLRFKHDPEVYALRFEILSNCVHDLILGKSFLKATKTFSSVANQARRVLTRIANKLTQHHALFLGDGAPRFSGTLNGKHQTALADSGCKVLLMDEDYAERLGLPILRGDGQRVKLVFADNSTAMSSGMVKGVRWTFGPNQQEQEYSLDFHVLKNAPAPVILSDKLLFSTDAYSRYACYLEDDDDEDDEAYFLAIDIVADYTYEGDLKSTANLQFAELVQKGEEDDCIAGLPNSQSASNSGQHGSTSTPFKRWKTRWRLKLSPKKAP
ncbi:hypothetical protein DE146DRAFT_633488 [Phaeosphaeria sp. MPI-PUGE-AT-0046c]|nr:hypothetical protein DE146DRAFT_633488 [Phaeosphaeria sp. MPI-PUGE-AT-0046c]